MQLKVVTKANRLPEIRVRVQRASRGLLREVARAVVDEMQTSFERAKHGRVYRYRGRLHRASAPGEAPAILTGALAGSIRIEFEGDTRVAVQIGAEHAVSQEFGTRKMAPRPFARTAAERTAERFGEFAWMFEGEL
jgi:HK97 gp10 family phage protein